VFAYINTLCLPEAKLLGVHPNYLHSLIRNLNLREQLKR
jgi:hypothetical protein